MKGNMIEADELDTEKCSKMWRSVKTFGMRIWSGKSSSNMWRSVKTLVMRIWSFCIELGTPINAQLRPLLPERLSCRLADHSNFPLPFLMMSSILTYLFLSGLRELWIYRSLLSVPWYLHLILPAAVYYKERLRSGMDELEKTMINRRYAGTLWRYIRLVIEFPLNYLSRLHPKWLLAPLVLKMLPEFAMFALFVICGWVCYTCVCQLRVSEVTQLCTVVLVTLICYWSMNTYVFMAIGAVIAATLLFRNVSYE